MKKEDSFMYEVIVFAGHEIQTSFVSATPVSFQDECNILADYPVGCWLDVARLEEDPLSDSICFRDEVEWELEPISQDDLEF
jgi:hypothetical protein